MAYTTSPLWLLVVPRPCMSSWFSTTWPLTVLRNGTPSWTYACLSVHGFALARGERLPCTCLTSAMWPSHRRLAHCQHETDARPASWCPSKQVPAITPFRSPTCSSLCPWLLSWLLQRYLPSSPLVEHASCPSGGYIGWHCSSSRIITWDPARPWYPAHEQSHDTVPQGLLIGDFHLD